MCNEISRSFDLNQERLCFIFIMHSCLNQDDAHAQLIMHMHGHSYILCHHIASSPAYIHTQPHAQILCIICHCTAACGKAGLVLHSRELYAYANVGGMRTNVCLGIFCLQAYLESVPV